MDEFIDAVKQSLVINNITSSIDITDNVFKEKAKMLETLKIDVNIPVFFIEELNGIRAINILNIANTKTECVLDYSDINKYTNLEILIISHNPNIRSLDVSKLTKLTNLILIGNHNLKELKGIESLKDLDRVLIVGNNIKHLDGAKSFLENNKEDTKMFMLDVNLYQDLLNQNINPDKYNISFAEKISVGELYHLDNKMMHDLYYKSIQILSGLLKDDMDIEERVLRIYKFIVNRLHYDFENLDKRNNYVYSHDINVYDNAYKDINSSYKAIMDYKVVCEGYANLFKFLLNIENIDAENVVCYLNDSNKEFEFYNHTASRVKINNEWLYCDAQLEKDSNHLQYFLKTKEEFEKTHKLPEFKVKR